MTVQLEEKSTVKIEPEAGVPEDKHWGFKIAVGEHTTFDVIEEDTWADNQTDLAKYVGWSIVKVNFDHVDKRQELLDTLEKQSPEDQIVFKLQRVCPQFKRFGNNAKQIRMNNTYIKFLDHYFNNYLCTELFFVCG